ETGVGAGGGCGTDASPEKDPCWIRLFPGKRAQPLRYDRPGQHLSERRGCGEILRSVPVAARRGNERGRAARGQEVPGPQTRRGGLERAEKRREKGRVAGPLGTARRGRAKCAS